MLSLPNPAHKFILPPTTCIETEPNVPPMADSPLPCPQTDSDRKVNFISNRTQAAYIAIIDYSVRNGFHSNAIFFAERFQVDLPGEPALYWLSRSYMADRQFKTAYALLSQSPLADRESVRCTFAMAQCCYELGMWADGEQILSKLVSPGEASSVLHYSTETVDRAACYYLLSKLNRKLCRIERAASFAKQALQCNPLLFTALTDLLEQGFDVHPEHFYQTEAAGWKWLQENISSTAQTPVDGVTSEEGTQVERQAAPRSLSSNNIENASVGGALANEARAISRPASAAPRRALGRTLSQDTLIPRRSDRVSANTMVNPVVNGRVASSGTREKKRRRNGAAKPAQPEPASVPMDVDAATATTDRNEDPLRLFVVHLFSVLKIMGLALRQHHAYRSRESLDVLSKLPKKHYDSPCVSLMVAKNHFENVDYRKAALFFETFHRLRPHAVEGMDIYSTTLWHLHKEKELSCLVHELMVSGYKTPQAWCAMGNSYSLQQDHNSALKCFQRALQLDESYAYAHNLSGHEYHMTETFDKALFHFRSAIKLDPRLYNSWYGLGMIYYLQEKYDMAEYHFRKALDINRTSTILQCYIGMVLHKTNRTDEALLFFDKAIQLDPNNNVVKYRKALCLMDLQEHEKALTYLQCVSEAAPKESAIHLKIGHVLKALDRKSEALKSYLTALDLTSKSSSVVKDAIDQLHASDTEMIDELFKSFD